MEEEFEGIEFASSADSAKPEEVKEEVVEQPKEEPKEEPKEAPAEQQEEKPEEAPKEDPYGKPGHTPSGVQERINGLTRDKHALKQENESLRAEVERLKKFVGIDREPTKEDFLKGGKTEDDYQNYVIDKRAKEVAQKMLEERDSANRRNELATRFNESESEARKSFADYDSVVYGDNPVRGSQKVVDALCELEGKIGADVVYVITKNAGLRQQYESIDDEAKIALIKDVGGKLYKMKTEAIEKGKAAQQQKPDVTITQKAPPPAQNQQIREPGQLQGSGSVRKKLDPSNCSMEEWMNDGF